MSVVVHKCGRCSHEWAGRKGTKTPKECPSCKSPLWNRKRKYKLKRLAYA